MPVRRRLGAIAMKDALQASMTSMPEQLLHSDRNDALNPDERLESFLRTVRAVWSSLCADKR